MVAVDHNGSDALKQTKLYVWWGWADEQYVRSIAQVSSSKRKDTNTDSYQINPEKSDSSYLIHIQFYLAN